MKSYTSFESTTSQKAVDYKENTSRLSIRNHLQLYLLSVAHFYGLIIKKKKAQLVGNIPKCLVKIWNENKNKGENIAEKEEWNKMFILNTTTSKWTKVYHSFEKQWPRGK